MRCSTNPHHHSQGANNDVAVDVTLALDPPLMRSPATFADGRDYICDISAHSNYTEKGFDPCTFILPSAL
jgi:hypothetical protein